MQAFKPRAIEPACQGHQPPGRKYGKSKQRVHPQQDTQACQQLRQYINALRYQGYHPADYNIHIAGKPVQYLAGMESRYLSPLLLEERVKQVLLERNLNPARYPDRDVAVQDIEDSLQQDNPEQITAIDDKAAGRVSGCNINNPS